MSDRAAGPVGSNPDMTEEQDEDRIKGRNTQTDENRDGYTDQTQRLDSGCRQEVDTTGHFVVSFKIPYWQCAGGTVVSISCGILAVLLALILRSPVLDTGEWMLEVQDRVGKAGVDVFRSYDLNRDGYLSIYEFEPLIPHLKNISSMLHEVMPVEKLFLEYTPKDGEEILTMHADFEPLQLDTMTTEDILTMDITGHSTLFGLRNWTEPNQMHAVFGASEFKSLMPSDMENPPLGVPYHVLPYGPASDGHQAYSATAHSSSRYYPPMPKDKEGVLFRLLGMMHHHPFLNMRFPPRGTVASVQAFNDKYIHVVFRMHAEFQLNEPPLKPFWFTPAQFLGDLVMSRDGTHVQYFHMKVPSGRRLNVDMEWITGVVEGEEGMEVDIGYMPLMEWTMDRESRLPLTEEEAKSGTAEHPPLQSPDQIEWSSEVPREDLLRLIEIEFYPFKKVTYHNLTQAVQLSKEENKPLHGVFLWGALDDQSC